MTKVTLVEFFNASNLLRMLTRFIKKLNLMFEQQQKENPEALDVKISHLKLLLLHSRYKTKGLELIADIDDMSTSWRQQLMSFIICKKVETLDSGFMEAGEQVKLDEDIALFRYDLYFTLTLMIDFWSQFFEERVDLNRLVSVSMKVFPFRKQIQQFWERIRHNESFSSAHTMFLYA
jgi:PAS domain-containing protein